MKKLMTMMFVATLAGCSQAPEYPMPTAQADAAVPTTGGDERHPVVVELYQSQGCSSCPPANANVNAIAGRRDILALSFGVTYWDRLGWTDTFASPANTERQWDYARAAGRSNVATPQIVINGGTQTVVGNRRDELDNAIAAAGPLTVTPPIDVMGDKLVVGPLAAQRTATVWFVRYDPREREVPIGSGENGGRTLPHRNVVRELVALGDWSGTKVKFPLPQAREAGLRDAVLLQRGVGGPIVAARKL